jgi:hypothetical protein
MDAWIKFAATLTEFLSKGIDAGVEHYRSRLIQANKVIGEMMFELRNKTQVAEALTCTLEVRNKRIAELENEITKLLSLMEDRR